MRDTLADIWKEKRSFALILLQLLGIGLVITLFNIEMHIGLPRLMPLLIGLFIVHALTPSKYKIASIYKRFCSRGIVVILWCGWHQNALLCFANHRLMPHSYLFVSSKVTYPIARFRLSFTIGLPTRITFST